MAISMKTTSGKLLASAALVATAAAVAGLGTYGGFTDSTAADAKVTAGTVDINLANGEAGLTVPAAGVLPGDTIERVVALSNAGNQNLSKLTLTTTDTATTPSALSTNGTSGLQLKVENCAQAWALSAGSYTCQAQGGATTVVISSPIIGANRDLGNTLGSLDAGGTDYLKITASLPSGADNTFQGLASTIKFDFNATQRTATTK
ncbi:CalY family protein [Arthrobacter sp. Marseille-P9274]|uniref:CalY family protein n=1 Tax=Arthrobacter sp. Marseille-P9274 TaxID=2866572 RepID=UPI0021CA69D4|nr:CalY family protein [Arthrobacter sp. Marseille-P9274]